MTQRSSPRAALALLLCLFFCGCASFPASAQTDNASGVLFLYSGGITDAPYALQLRNAFIEVWSDKLNRPFEVFVDSVDSLLDDKLTDREHRIALAAVLQERYRQQNVRVIVAVGNEAIDFAVKHGSEIAPHATILYEATPFTPLPEVMKGTGISLTLEMASTIDIALHQNPGTQNVFVVAGTAAFERGEMAMARKEFHARKDVEFHFLEAISYTQLMSTAATLPPHSVILFLGFARDSTGAVRSSVHVTRVLSKVAHAPIYTVFGSPIGYGAVGGNAVDYNEIGRVLGEQGLAMIKGARLEDMPPVVASFQRPTFDIVQLQRWKISQATLPPNSLLLNQRPSLWREYRWWILGGLAVFLFQSLLMLRLQLERRRKNAAELQLGTETAREESFAEFAAALLHAPEDLFWAPVAKQLEALMRRHDLDRVTLIHALDERKVLRLQHIVGHWMARADEKVPYEQLSWVAEILRSGRSYSISSLNEIPEQETGMREFLLAHSIRSLAVFPLDTGGEIAGALAFSSSRRDVEWSGTLAHELQTVSDLFSNAQQRKDAAETLRIQEELNGRILDSLAVHLAVINREGRILAVNRAWRDFWVSNGGLPESMPGIGSDYLAPLAKMAPFSEEPQRMLSGIWAVLQGDQAGFEMEYDCSAPSQRRRFISVVVPLLQRAGAVIAHRDVTERWEAEMRLRESEKRFRTIGDSVPVMIWLADADQQCTYVNRQWLEFTGRTLEQEFGFGWIDSIHPEDRDAAAGTFREAFAARRPFHMEYRLRRADGIYGWILDRGKPRYLADGGFAGYIGGGIEITIQKEAEQQRERMSAMLITAQEQERASIARELHDHICQRLALVAIGLQTFEQKNPELATEQLGEVDDLFKLTIEISHDIQQVSHQLHSSPLQHLGLVAALHNLTNEFSRHGRIATEFSHNEMPKFEESQSLALFRVAQEALRNVERHSSASLVEVTLRWEREVLYLRISDNGIGFDPLKAEDGLGLVSMRERTRLIGGAIVVTSSPAHGTTVEARIPMKKPMATIKSIGAPLLKQLKPPRKAIP